MLFPLRFTVGAILLVTVCLQGPHAYSANNCDFLENTGPTLKGFFDRIGKPSIEIEIPRSYMPTRAGTAGRLLGNVRGILIHASLSDLKPATTERSQSSNVHSTSDQLSLLIEDRLALEAVKSAILNTFEMNRLPKGGALKVEYGLSQVVFDGGESNRDYYLNESGGKLADFIMCTKPQPKHNSNSISACRHYSEIISDIPVIIDYPKKNLSRWAYAKTQSEQLLKCFIVK